MKDAALGAILSPTPFPQVIKPAFEVYINRNFFTGRPLIGVFEQKKEAERLFNDSTSELAKVLGSSGLISPIALDHLIRGMFGSFGGVVLWGSNYMIQSDPNVERPDLTWRDALAALPGTSGLLSKPSENALKNDFYLLRDEVEKAKSTFDDYKKYSPQGLEEYVNNEKAMARLAMAKQVEKISTQLSKIRTSIKQINQMPSSMISAEEKEQAIKDLRQAEKDMLKAAGVPEMRKAAQL
jgi:ribosomal protein S20